MRAAYLQLHRLGHAHSIEIRHDGVLAGGLYGVRLGGVFFGESMFSRRRDASKAALAHLVALCRRNALAVIDCQLPSQHLASLGARSIPRGQFQGLLAEHAHAGAAAARKCLKIIEIARARPARCGKLPERRALCSNSRPESCLRAVCRRKMLSRWRARSPRPCPTRLSA